MKNTPLLSIVIPTRNREVYCIQAIQHILSFSEIDFELVIQDNSDSLNVFNYVENLNDTRVKYNYTKLRLNSLINMDLAISMANGQYITMIGDNDTVLSEIFNITRYAQNNNIDAISQKDVVQYFWPGSYDNCKTGELCYPDYTYQITHPDLTENLNSYLRNGMIDYLSYDLPKVYHGIISKSILDKVKNKTGHYFGGLSPDIYAAMSLTFYVTNFIMIDCPFTIAGTCAASTTAQNKQGGHRGELKSAPHLELRGDYEWDKRIPQYYSVETIWAETAIKSLIENDKEYLLKEFSLSRFIVFSLWRGNGIRKLMFVEISRLEISLLKKTMLIFEIFAILFFEGAKKLFKHKSKREMKVVYDCINIERAANFIKETLPENNLL